MDIIAKNWTDYECIDAGDNEKLDRWHNVILRRPDPTAIWPKTDNTKIWENAAGHYHRSSKGGGKWEFKQKVPEYWTVNYKNLTFKVSPTGFKHTGLFPEQAANWDYIDEKIKSAKTEQIRILNLFAYTGGATMAASAAGASEVVHVDASKGMVNWAKENMRLSKLDDNKIRFIVDDVNKFVEREIRRGRTYHGIIMDPPSYGRGPNNEIWQIEELLYPLINNVVKLLDDQALFFIINSYTTGFSLMALKNIMRLTISKRFSKGKITTGSIGLPITNRELILPCGIYGRFEL
ncbi:MAG: class I SAM-dependent methyltransferase [Erysipelotrichaceae bacterium]|nr:class I SAM-dependent methyltransferase [Erysipelotrichaceae bacterium]